MKKLYTTDSAIELEIIKSILEGEGINCLIKDEFPQSMNLPNIMFWPNLWVIDDEKLEEAERILQRLLKEQKQIRVGVWTCPNCGTEVNSELNICWKCNAGRPE